MYGAIVSQVTGPHDEKSAISSLLSVAPIAMLPDRPPVVSDGCCHGLGQFPGQRTFRGGMLGPSLPAQMKYGSPAAATLVTHCRHKACRGLHSQITHPMLIDKDSSYYRAEPKLQFFFPLAMILVVDENGVIQGKLLGPQLLPSIKDLLAQARQRMGS